MEKAPNAKVIGKIQKLFARRESNFEAEAEAALLKAQELMMQHGLSMSDIQNHTDDPVIQEDIICSHTPAWQGRIAVILANNFRCKIMWNRITYNGKRVKVVCFIGFASDIEVVKAAYNYAIALVRRNVRVLKKRFPRATTAYFNAYIEGFIQGIYTKFKEQVDRNQWGLVVVTPLPVQKYFTDLRTVPSKKLGRKPVVSKNENAYKKGFIDGKYFENTNSYLES